MVVLSRVYRRAQIYASVGLLILSMVLTGIIWPEQADAGESGMYETTLIKANAEGGGAHTCSIVDGKVYCWGGNWEGQLGDGTTTNKLSPTAVNTSGVLGGKTVTDIAMGEAHTCVVADGAVYCWGWNGFGQLGDNSTSQRTSPVAVYASGVLSGKTVTRVTAGYAFTCAIADGKAYCWGEGTDGRLGNNLKSNSSVPVTVYASGVLNGKTVTDLDSGDGHTCVIADSKMYCWGWNGFGQLGDGSTTSKSIPTITSTAGVLNGKNLTKVAVGYAHTCTLAVGGGVYCWGEGTAGRLGNGSYSHQHLPKSVDMTGVLNGKAISDLSAGDSHTCVVANSQVYCWGSGSHGELGRNSTYDFLSPTEVDTSGVLEGREVQKVSAGDAYTCALSGGIVYCWGWNDRGRLGDNTTVDKLMPIMVPMRTGFKGGSYNFYRNANSLSPGSPLAVSDQPAQLAAGNQKFRSRIVMGGGEVWQIASGEDHSCAVANGKAYCWGRGTNGRLGNGSTTDKFEPTPVDDTGFLAGKTITDITASGAAHTCAVADGKAYCWGYNNRGQLGDGTTTSRSTPVPVGGSLSSKTVTSISAGNQYTCAVADGDVYCWGYNNRGQLGDNSLNQRTTPAAVNTSGWLNGKTVTRLTTGYAHTCVVASSRAYCWGEGSNGRLGNDDFVDVRVPVPVFTDGVLGNKVVTEIAAGDGHTCIVADGKAYCWGWNAGGQLGNNSTGDESSAVPVSTWGVLGSKTVTQISAGYAHTCAIANNNAYCWGAGDNGRLGNNDTSIQQVPVAVYTDGVLGSKKITEVSAGDAHTCAIREGDLFCWGLNTYGQLGDGTVLESSVPRLADISRLARSKLVTKANKFVLQFAQLTSSSCSAQTTGFANVTSSTAIAFSPNSNVVNNSAISTSTYDPLPSLAVVPQVYRSSSGEFTNITDVPRDKYALFDFSLRDNSAPQETTYCLRIAYSSGLPLETMQYYPEIKTARQEVSVGVVNSSGAAVASPSFDMNPAYMQTKCQEVTGVLGVNNQRLRVFNSMASGSWGLSIAAKNGPTATWQRTGGGTGYDFNDPTGIPPGCLSGMDGDGLAGVLGVSPSGSTISPQSECSITGMSKGADGLFNQGPANSIPLVTTSALADTGCYWDITNIGLLQRIPASQINGTYSLDISLTVVAS